MRRHCKFPSLVKKFSENRQATLQTPWSTKFMLMITLMVICQIAVFSLMQSRRDCLRKHIVMAYALTAKGSFGVRGKSRARPFINAS